jgi:phosphoheptose isomerase
MTYFPDRHINHAGSYADAYYSLFAQAAASVDGEAIDKAARLVVETTKAGRRIYSCGNGGSAAIANHLVCDCLKGIRSNTALRPKVYSLSSPVELITAIVNDIGSEEMFSFQLSSVGEPGDLLITISSSGTSPNIVRTLKLAKTLGLSTIAMSGFSGGASRELADVSLHVACENYGVIEDVHQSLMHIIAQFVRSNHLEEPEKIGHIKF